MRVSTHQLLSWPLQVQLQLNPIDQNKKCCAVLLTQVRPTPVIYKNALQLDSDLNPTGLKVSDRRRLRAGGQKVGEPGPGPPTFLMWVQQRLGAMITSSRGHLKWHLAREEGVWCAVVWGLSLCKHSAGGKASSHICLCVGPPSAGQWQPFKGVAAPPIGWRYLVHLSLSHVKQPPRPPHTHTHPSSPTSCLGESQR